MAWKLKYIKGNKIDKMCFDFRNGKCKLMISENHDVLPVHKHNFDELVVVYSGSAVKKSERATSKMCNIMKK